MALSFGGRASGGRVTFDIEFHDDESTSSYFSNYDPAKYQELARRMEDSFMQAFEERGIPVEVKKNESPPAQHEYQNMRKWYQPRAKQSSAKPPSMPPGNAWSAYATEQPQRRLVRYPRHGAFEVTMKCPEDFAPPTSGLPRTLQVWSKIQSKKWPNPDSVAGFLAKMLETAQGGENVAELVRIMQARSKLDSSEGNEKKATNRPASVPAKQPMLFGLFRRAGPAPVVLVNKENDKPRPNSRPASALMLRSRPADQKAPRPRPASAAATSSMPRPSSAVPGFVQADEPPQARAGGGSSRSYSGDIYHDDPGDDGDDGDFEEKADDAYKQYTAAQVKKPAPAEALATEPTSPPARLPQKVAPGQSPMGSPHASISAEPEPPRLPVARPQSAAADSRRGSGGPDLGPAPPGQVKDLARLLLEKDSSKRPGDFFGGQPLTEPLNQQGLERKLRALGGLDGLRFDGLFAEVEQSAGRRAVTLQELISMLIELFPDAPSTPVTPQATAKTGGANNNSDDDIEEDEFEEDSEDEFEDTGSPAAAQRAPPAPAKPVAPPAPVAAPPAPVAAPAPVEPPKVAAAAPAKVETTPPAVSSEEDDGDYSENFEESAESPAKSAPAPARSAPAPVAAVSAPAPAPPAPAPAPPPQVKAVPPPAPPPPVQPAKPPSPPPEEEDDEEEEEDWPPEDDDDDGDGYDEDGFEEDKAVEEDDEVIEDDDEDIEDESEQFEAAAVKKPASVASPASPPSPLGGSGGSAGSDQNQTPQEIPEYDDDFEDD